MSTDVGLYIVLTAMSAFIIFHSLLLLAIVRALHDLRVGLGGTAPSEALAEMPLLGQTAPPFVADAIDGRHVGPHKYRGRRAAILFVSTGCSSCAATLAEVRAVDFKADGGLLIVCRGDPGDCRGLASSYGLRWPFVADVDGSIGNLYHIGSYPTAVLLDPDGAIQSHGSPRREDLEAVVAGGST